jgi:hypothetical protein
MSMVGIQIIVYIFQIALFHWWKVKHKMTPNVASNSFKVKASQVKHDSQICCVNDPLNAIMKWRKVKEKTTAKSIVKMILQSALFSDEKSSKIWLQILLCNCTPKALFQNDENSSKKWLLKIM